MSPLYLPGSITARVTSPLAKQPSLAGSHLSSSLLTVIYRGGFRYYSLSSRVNIKIERNKKENLKTNRGGVGERFNTIAQSKIFLIFFSTVVGRSFVVFS